MGGVRVRVVPVRGDAPRGRVVRLPAGTGGFRHGGLCGACGACGACVSRRRGWRPLRHGGAGRAGRGWRPLRRWCLACRDGWLPHRRVELVPVRLAAVPALCRARRYGRTRNRRVVPIRSARADPHRVMPCPPEAGGFRTGGSCSRCRYDWPSSDTVVRAAKPHRHGDAVPAGSGRLPHRRVELVPVRLAAAPALCRARRYGRTRTDGWCRSGRRGRTRTGWCRPVRAGRPRRVVPGCRMRRGRPARVRRVRTSGR